MALIPVVIEKSPLNFVPFVQENGPITSKYDQRHLGTTWEINTYAKNLVRQPYYYKLAIADVRYLQFHFTYSNVGPTIRLYLLEAVKRPNGTEMMVKYQWSPVSQGYIPNNTVDVNGVAIPQISVLFRFSMADVPNLQEGDYFLRFEILYSTDNNATFANKLSDISEPIRVRRNHPNTLELSGSNRTNDYSTAFTGTYISPFIASNRVEGMLLGYTPDSVDTDFTSQRGRVTKTSSEPNFTERLVIGGNIGIPQGMKAWVNYWASLDKKIVNDREITKDSGGGWEEIIATPRYPLGGLSMPIRLADKSAPYKTIQLPFVTLFTRPVTGYPYAVWPAAIKRTGFASMSLGGPYVIRGLADEANVASAMQVKVAMNGMSGQVLLQGNQIVYQNGLGELYDTSETVVLPVALNAEVQMNTSGTHSFTATGSRLVVDWGDGSSNGYGTGSSASLTPSHAYTPGVFNTTVFHANTFTEISLASVTPRIRAISGKISNTTTSFSIANNLLQSFDISVVQPAYATLATFVIRQNQIASIANLNLLSAVGAKFAVLIDVAAHVNKLPVSVVDNTLVAVDAANTLNNGSLSLFGQTPPAPPTSTGPGSAYNNLVNNRNWTVTTD